MRLGLLRSYQASVTLGAESAGLASPQRLGLKRFVFQKRNDKEDIKRSSELEVQHTAPEEFALLFRPCFSFGLTQKGQWQEHDVTILTTEFSTNANGEKHKE